MKAPKPRPRPESTHQQFLDAERARRMEDLYRRFPSPARRG